MFDLPDIPTERLIWRTASHIYLAPHRLLRRCVTHYTVLLSSNLDAPLGLTLIPDASGCIVLIPTAGGLECLLWGPTTQAVVVQNDIGLYPFRFFIEFLPGGGRAALGRDMSELADVRLPLRELDAALHTEICAAFECSHSLRAFFDALDELLLRRVAGSLPSSVERLLPYLQSRAACSVGALSRDTFYSERQLGRLLSPVLGMSVKRYLRLLRLNQAVLRIAAGERALTRLAQELGFFDQAHFIHDFKAFCGVSPTAYLDRSSDFYNEPHKF